MNFRTAHEAVATWRADRPIFESRGVHLPFVQGYVSDDMREDYRLAMDAIPSLFTEPNSAVPAMLTTVIDPKVFEVLFAPNRAAEILGEQQKGTWLDDTALFPVAESTGEVSSYGDYNTNGRAGVNTSWPNRQAYLFQTHKEYGEREMERAGLARIDWVSKIDQAAALTINKFFNYTYFFGVQGLENYGILNDPLLSAPVTPTTKAAGGTAWVNASGQPNATPNEVYADIQTLFQQLVDQTAGLVEQDTPMVLVYGTAVASALTSANSFGVNVSDLIKKNFPNLELMSAVQYNRLSSLNPQGVAAGNMLQLIVKEIEGQETGYAAYNEKMRQHPVIRKESSFRQKLSAGTWGAVIRMPAAIASMVGV